MDNGHQLIAIPHMTLWVRWAKRLRCCYRYKNSTLLITIWLAVAKYPHLKWQWIFYFLCRRFLFFITAKTLARLDCILAWVTWWLSYMKQELLNLHPQFFGGVVLLILLAFCVVLLYVFMLRVPCCDVCYNFRIKTIFGSFLPPLVCNAHILFMLFVFVCIFKCSGVQHTLFGFRLVASLFGIL